eukprot:scaffold24952_cov101-Isochrysis_galbana.AAC.3
MSDWFSSSCRILDWSTLKMWLGSLRKKGPVPGDGIGPMPAADGVSTRAAVAAAGGCEGAAVGRSAGGGGSALSDVMGATEAAAT